MISREQFLGAVHHEFGVIRHLMTKIPAGGYEYRPTEKQRSTLELLQYLSVISSSTMSSLLNKGTWPEDYDSRMQSATIENMNQRFGEEEARIAELFPKFTEEVLSENIDLFGLGDTRPVATYLLNILQWLSAYKMQLFLYAKSAGNSALNTGNAWSGKDISM